MRKLVLVVAATLAATVSFGKITELESGDLWSSATWSDGAPRTGDDVIIRSSCTFDLDDVTLHSLTFAGTAGATLSAAPGYAVAISGGIAVQDAATFSLAAPVTLTESQTWTVVNSGVLSIDAPLTAASGLTLTQGNAADQATGVTKFNVASPDALCAFTLNFGVWQVYAPQYPFGNPAKGTLGLVKIQRTVSKQDYCHLEMYGTEIANKVWVNFQKEADAIHSMVAPNAAGITTNTILGQVQSNANTLFLCANKNTELHFRGGWDRTTNLIRCKGNNGNSMKDVGRGTVVIRDVPWTIGGWYRNNESVNMRYDVAGCRVSLARSTWGEVNGYNAITMQTGCTHQMTTDFALNGTDGAGYFYGFYGTFDLNGHDQRTGGFYAEFLNGNNVGTITSATPATLYVRQVSSLVQQGPYNGYLSGAVTLSKSGPNAVTLGGGAAVRIFETSGGVEVTEGDLVLNQYASFPNATVANVVATNANARLCLQSTGNLSSKAVLRLVAESDHTAKVELAAGVTVAVGELWLNGVKQGAGTYSAASHPDWFAGEGSVRIDRQPRADGPVTTTWTGAKGTTSWKDDGNWDNGAPQTGDSVVLNADVVYDNPDDVTLGKVTFAGEAPYAISANAGRFVVVTGGVEVTGAFCRTNALPIQILEGQRWTAETGSRLALNAEISSVPAAGLIFGYGSGIPNVHMGAFDLNVPNPNLQGAVNINACTVNVYAPTAPFGAEGKGLVNVFYYVNETDRVVYEARLNLYGTTIPNKIKTNFINGSFSGTSVQKERSLVYSCTGTNVISGQVQHNGSFAPAALKGSTLVFRGGWSGDSSNLLFRPKDGSRGDIVFDTIPWRTGGFGYDGNYENNYIFSVASNRVTGNNDNDAYLSLQCHSACRFVTTVDWAFDGDEKTEIHRFWGTFDMQGHPSRVGGFGNTSASTTITSPTPAVLYMKQGCFSKHKYIPFSGSITGGAGISKSGLYDMVIASDASKLTTTGLLEVTEGTLCLTNTARWANGTDIRVIGTNTAANASQGNLKLCARENLNRKAVLTVVGTGTVEIPSGVTVSVFRLLKGDDAASLVEMEPGDYSSGFVTGGGTLHVRGEGLMVIVK